MRSRVSCTHYDTGGHSLNQLVSISAPGINRTYNYPSGAKVGKISTPVDDFRGDVQYAYDSLNRLDSATTTAGTSQTFTYDSFAHHPTPIHDGCMK